MHWAWEVETPGMMKLLAPVFGLLGRQQERRIWGDLKVFSSRRRANETDAGHREFANVAREAPGRVTRTRDCTDARSVTPPMPHCAS